MGVKSVKDVLKDCSLILMDEDKPIFESRHSGIRPLLMCITKMMAGKDIRKVHEGCVLYDKVIGLAAARLIIYSGLIKQVHTILASRKAVDLLKTNGIRIHAENIVENILNRDRTAMCPMEKKATEFTDNDLFYKHLVELLSV